MPRITTENGVDFEFDNNLVIRRDGEDYPLVGTKGDELKTFRLNGYVIVPKEKCAIVQRADNLYTCPCLLAALIGGDDDAT